MERQALIALDFIAREKAAPLRDLFRLAFGAGVVGFSNYCYEPSLGTRAAAGKPDVLEADVAAVMRHKLLEMLEDIVTFQGWLKGLDRKPRARVYGESFFDGAARLEQGSVDVLITSPPYLNNYHYIRNTRPHMFWLGMVQEPSDLKEMEKKSFGQFWQTVRSGPEVPLVPDIPELTERIRLLKTRNVEKGNYGGQGWANYAASYFNDCRRFSQAVRRVMKPGGCVVVVIGNNILQGVEFPTDRYFAEIARQEGFEIAGLHEVRNKRTGNSILNSSVRAGTVRQRTRLYETAVELRAPVTA